MKNTVQRAVVFLLGTTLLSGCFSKNPTNDIRQVLTQSKFAKDRFINKSYYDDRPLAQFGDFADIDPPISLQIDPPKLTVKKSSREVVYLL